MAACGIDTDSAGVERAALQDRVEATNGSIRSGARLEVDVLEDYLLVAVLDTDCAASDLHLRYGNRRSSLEQDTSMVSRASRHVDLDITKSISLSDSPP